MKRSAVVAAALGLAVGAAAAAEPAPGQWAWRGTLYGWFPSVQSSTQRFDAGGGNTIGIERDPDDYLSNLEFVFMGALEARNGPWSVVGDAIFLNFGSSNARVKTISGPFGAVSVPLQSSVSTDLEGTVLTALGGYSLSRSSDLMDVVFGVRYARVKTTLDWTFGGPAGSVPTQGSAQTSKNFTDVIVGLRGRASLSPQWFVPYHFDVGAGSSQITWQALVGIGYRFGWGDVAAVFRHLSYDFKSDAPLDDLTFGGPAIGVSFTF